jgi:hypothetical protein
MAMFLAAVTIPALAWARRRDGGWDAVFFGWAACLLLVNSHLYQGLSFLSLQELTGACFVALGLAIRAPGWRGLCWVAAAWMKAPFAWLLIAYAVWLAVRRDTRWKGLALGAAGAGTVLLAALASRRGTYTSGYTLSVERAVSSMQTALPLFGWVAVVAVLGLLMLRVDVRRLGWRDPLALVFTAGGLGYLVTLLPWGVQAYYGGPVVWMLSVAGIRLVATAPRREPSLRQPMTALLAALVVLAAGRMVWIMGGVQYDRNASVVGLRDWALELPRSGVVIGVNGPEAALRLGEIMRLRDPRWDNEFVNIDDTDGTTAVDFYVQLEDQGAGNPRLTRGRVAALPRANVFAS